MNDSVEQGLPPEAPARQQQTNREPQRQAREHGALGYTLTRCHIGFAVDRHIRVDGHYL